MPGMSPTYHASAASTPIASSAISKMRGSGLLTPTAPESITHSTSTPTPGPTCNTSCAASRCADGPVGVGDHTDAYAGADERAQPVDRAGNDPGPEVAHRELAVEVRVHFLADAGVVADSCGRDVRLEVAAPVVLPIDLADADIELGRTRVVRAVEDVGRDIDVGSREGADDAIVVGEVEDAADVEQHGLGCRHPLNLAGFPRAKSLPFLPTRVVTL